MSRRMLIALLALVGAFVALYLTLYKVGVIGQLSCSIGSCETVNTSEWSRFLGAPVAAWGLGFYLAVLAISIIGIQDRFADDARVSLLLALMSGTGVLFSLWLTYLELFVIHAICVWCVTSAVIVTGIFLVSIWDVLREKGRRPETIEREVTGEESETASALSSR